MSDEAETKSETPICGRCNRVMMVDKRTKGAKEAWWCARCKTGYHVPHTQLPFGMGVVTK